MSQRVISLIASATETVAALGCLDRLVARSHECDYPAPVTKLPAVTEPKFAVDGTSHQIDERVRALVAEGLSVYRVHAHQLDALQPDLILTQSQCEVCAVSLRDVEEAVCRMVSSRPRIVSLEPNSLADIWRDIQTVADALGVPARGKALVSELQRNIKADAAMARSASSKPRVACIEWIDPLMAAGNWMPELVELAGGENVFGEAGKHSPALEWAALVEADPDIIVVLPCGWDMDRAEQDLPALTQRPEWRSLRAVRDRRVYLTDGNRYFNRPGPRIAESHAILCEMLHPGIFGGRRQGVDWRRFDG